MKCNSLSFKFRPAQHPFMKTSFQQCFKKVIGTQQNSFYTLGTCKKPVQIKECQQYCEWHDQYTKSADFAEFLTLMKYGLPQRKWTSNEVLETEAKLAKKMLGESNVISGDIQGTQSPAPLPLICEREQHEQTIAVEREDVGMQELACDNFFPTPTDKGICLTENLNIKEVMNDYEVYEPLMESSMQKKSSSKITGGAKWSQKTYVIASQRNSLLVRNS